MRASLQQAWMTSLLLLFYLDEGESATGLDDLIAVAFSLIAVAFYLIAVAFSE
jgi:hypothetical protein